MYSKNNNLALKYGFGVDQSQIGPNSNAYTTRMDALSAIPDPVAGAVTNNNKLGTGSDPRFNAASQAANNVSDKGWAQNIDYGTAREAWKESFPEGQMNFLDFAEGLDLPGQGFGQDDQSGQDAGGAGRHGSKAYWDWIDKSKGVGAQTEIHTIGSQHAADASIDAGWGQDYSVDVEGTQPRWAKDDLPLTSMPGSGQDPYMESWGPGSSQASFDKQPPVDEKNLTPAQLQKINASKKLTPSQLQHKRAKQKAAHKKMLKGLEPGPLAKPTRPDTSTLSYEDEFEGQYDRFANEGKGGWGSSGSSTYSDAPAPLGVARDTEGILLDANEYEDMVGSEIGTFEDMAIDQDFATNAGEGQTLGSTLGKTWGKFDKTFESIGGGGTAIAAGAKVLGDILKSSKSQGLQEDLRGMKGQVESAVGSLANLKYAEQDAEKERFGEESRQAGGVENIALSDTLTKIREISQGGLSSGSKSRLIDKATDDSQTKTDIVIADSYDKHLDKMAGIQETSVSERSQLNEKLTEIDRQIADLDHSWMDTALDVGQIVATGMNPAFGMAYAGARTLA